MIAVINHGNAQLGQNIKIENCRVEIMNSASEILKLEHMPIHDQLLIQQNSDQFQFQRRPITQR